jgi:hypothetical protein
MICFTNSRFDAVDVLAEDGILLLEVGGLFLQLPQLMLSHLQI